MPINMLFLCLLPLLLSACLAPKESGLFGRFPENYTDPEDGFTLWMPANMRSRFGINHAYMQELIDDCVSDRYRGYPYVWSGIDVYKQLDENTRLYAYYYYYNKNEPPKAEVLPFDRKLSDVRVRYITVINMTVDKEGLITGCKYWRFRR
ncbi:hypothetical protein [uncultured Desulfovibrio sp.]|uniref:Lipoprotein n=1 Tax=Candidatus Desulfovibrio intestinavium TaxID=2838534 RepID=A0A9D2KQ46_9BACT|nr:hypothetical protein [uncultured Desulfovibrio sp.]HJA79407.1 hypothetical protein [Candidatus Desulfovibrio intestinavium]